LAGANGLPGSEVVVPFYIGANVEVGGYNFSVDFDEEVLRATQVEEVFKAPDGADYAFANFFLNNNDNNPGNGGVDEGFIIGGVVFSFTEPVSIPPGDHKALNFHFTINPETQATSTEVRFLDGGQCSEPHPHPPDCHMGGPQRNSLNAFGTTIY